MVVAHGITQPFSIVGSNGVENIVWLLLEESATTVAAIYYAQKETPANQMKRNEKIQSSHSQQTNADWRQQDDISENFSQYRQNII